jgi:uncharacterized delta-60 repeat protein
MTMGRIRRLGAGLALILAAVAFAGAGSATANPGQVEIAYGGKGSGSVDITPTLPSGGSSELVGLAVGPRNESLVLAGSFRVCAYITVCAEYTVRRFGGRGGVDNDFGARVGTIAGDSWVPDGAPKFPAGALAVQPDRKIVVALGLLGGVTLLRLNPDGTPDPTFGAGGRLVTALGGRPTVTSVAVRKDGGIVVAGGVANPGGSDLFLARYSDLGQLDSRFGTGGLVIADLGTEDLPAGVALQDGEVLVGAPRCCSQETVRLSFARFSEAGAMSPLFGGGTPPGLAAEDPTGISTVIPGPGGSLKLVGSGREGAFVSSYLPNGQPDLDFGKRGEAFIPDFFVDGGAAAVRDRQGGIVLVGRRPVSNAIFEGSEALTIKRIKPNGRVDTLFGGARPNLLVEERGRRIGLDLGRSIAVAMQANGRIVALVRTPEAECIRTCEPPIHFGLVRYFGVTKKRPARCQGRVATIVGTPRNETLNGTPRRDVIAAFAGADTVRGRGGNDLICGGPGADLLLGGGGQDQLRGGPGRDRVRQ